MSVVKGITPAGAGNRGSPARCLRLEGDHPRGCGEQPAGSCRHVGQKGSPPRVRGTGSGHKRRSSLLGITPAGAGNSHYSSRNCSYIQDHPRGCGEQPAGSCRHVGQKGSPPRVRGTGSGHKRRSSLLGITPAGAGNSHYSSRNCSYIQDHPRGCGEQPAGSCRHVGQKGSPPRVRGTGYRLEADRR